MNSYYLGLDLNLPQKIEVVKLKHKLGYSGLGLYIELLLKLAQSDNYKLPCDYDLLAYEFRVDSSYIQQVIENFNLFTIENNNFYCENVIEKMKILEKKKEAGRAGGIASGMARRKGKKKTNGRSNGRSTVVQTVVEQGNIINKENIINKINKTNKEKIKEFFENENLRNLVEKKLVPYENQVWWSEQANSTIQEIKEGMLIFYEKKPPIKNMKLTFYTWLNKKDRKLFYKYKKTSENEYNAPLTTNYNDDLTPEEEERWNREFAHRHPNL